MLVQAPVAPANLILSWLANYSSDFEEYWEFCILLQTIFRKSKHNKNTTYNNPLTCFVYLMLKYLDCGGIMCNLCTSVDTFASLRTCFCVFPISMPPKCSTAGLAWNQSFWANFEYISRNMKMCQCLDLDLIYLIRNVFLVQRHIS